MSKSLPEHILRDNPAVVISIVGAGGKTTTALRLVSWFKECGRTPVLTTTTHMMRPDTPDFIQEESLEQVKDALRVHGSAWVGIPCKNQRIGAVSDSFFEKLCGLGVPVIVEADGARRKPFKIPADWEPVIPGQTNVVIGVLGLDALGRPIEEVCYRPEEAARFLGKELSQCLEAEDYVKAGLSEQGLRKNVSSEMEYYIILSKAEDEIRRNNGEHICRLFAEKGMQKVSLIRRTQ